MDYLNSLPEEEKNKLLSDLGAQDIVRKLSKTMANSVNELAWEVQRANAERNRQTT